MILASAPPFAVWLTVAAATAYAVAAAGRNWLHPRIAHGAVLMAWLLHGLVLAWGLLGHSDGYSPHFGFAPALSVTVWLVVAVYYIELNLYPQLKARWALCALGSAAVVVALFFPGQVLATATSPWLPIHWVLGVTSYGLFGAAVVHAWLMTQTEEHIRLATDSHIGLPLLTLERLTFRFVAAGFFLLSATLLIAFFLGSTLYGAGAVWRWDHKAVFSVLSWLTFALLLLGRSRWGWRGKQAVRVLYVGAGFLLLAYVGSRFVMEIVLDRAP